MRFQGMRIVVFGSTGRAGSAVVERALDMGHDVTAFARSPERLAWLQGREGLHIALGDATDEVAVVEALKGGDAVVSALGSGTLDPTTHLSEMTADLVAAMRSEGPARLVALSHVGVLLKKVDAQYQHVVDEHRRNLVILEESGLAGRGGAGFPTWRKWKAVRDAPGDPKSIVCNADEGEPGCFKDRALMDHDPHGVLEGMILAGFATGAPRGFIYLRYEYPETQRILEEAIGEAEDAGFLGEAILGTDFSFQIH
ncbi:MAG: NAD(P)H-binding protein, partial [Actinobacteria bacterium]|nr:NAD(P)H-binding protein [Actinomycetota bacterium]